jgi:hypothetical protein
MCWRIGYVSNRLSGVHCLPHLFSSFICYHGCCVPVFCIVVVVVVVVVVGGGGGGGGVIVVVGAVVAVAVVAVAVYVSLPVGD